ncbi:MAG: redoxin family protein [Aristaeellaceae bacterium]
MAKKWSAWWAAHKPSKRRLIQVYAALLYNAHLKGFIQGDIYVGPLKNVCVPGFNCYSCPGAIGACPLGALQNALASADKRAPWYVLGILMLYGLTLGRTICGWLCPLGLIQELLHKLPTPKIPKGSVTRALSYLKYILLALFVIGLPLIYSAQRFPVPGFCKYICPAGTLEGAMGLLANPVNAEKFSMLNILFTRKFLIMVGILTLCVFCYRAFCRFLCPLGAIYGLFARLSVLGVRVEANRCTDCGRCVATCRMDVRRVGDHECIHCGECIDVCPTKAIRMKAGKYVLMQGAAEVPGAPHEPGRTGKRRMQSLLAWALALALLAAVLWFVNQDAPTQQTADMPTAEAQLPGDDTPVGKEVGMRCPDFTVALYGPEGGTTTLDAHRGRVLVLNFWATWCTPCVAELPHFERVQAAYGEQVDILAIHSDMVTDDVQSFIDAEELALTFALDETGEVIRSLGGSTQLPMTVIVDRNGMIVYNKVGSMNEETLRSLIDPLV